MTGKITAQPSTSSEAKRLGNLLTFLLVISSSLFFWRLAYMSIGSVIEVPFQTQLMLIFGGLRKDLFFLALALSFIVSTQILWTMQTHSLSRKLIALLHYLLSASLVVFILYSAFMRVADLICFYYSGTHLGIFTLYHLIEGVPSWSIAKPLQIFLLLAFLCTTLSLWLFLKLISLHPKQNTRTGHSFISLSPPIFLLLLTLLYHPSKPQAENKIQQKIYAKLDQTNFFPGLSIIWDFFSEKKGILTEQEELSPELIAKLNSFGLFYNTNAKFPLVKNWVSQKEFPFPKSSNTTEKPNITILFFEGFSASLTSVYPNPQYPGLTPALEAFAKESTSIKGVYNSSIPTLNAVKSTLCSYLLTVRVIDWFKTPDSHKNFNCLPQILKRAGYHTYAVLGLDGNSLKHSEDLQIAGIEHIIDKNRLQSLFEEEALSWGYSDHQLFDYLNRMIKRKMFKEPFFLILETIDSHPPFNLAKDAFPKYRDGKNPVLNSFRSTDHAFGEFWKAQQLDSLHKRTITVALADHALYPGRQFQETSNTNVRGKTYGEIMLIINNPLHDMIGNFDITSSQIDLAPTLLHLLDIQVPNHFEGLSIFGERQDYPQVLGMNQLVFFTKQRHKNKEVLDFFSLDGKNGLPAINTTCSSTVPEKEELLTRCDFLSYYRWKRRIHEKDRIWP